MPGALSNFANLCVARFCLVIDIKCLLLFCRILLVLVLSELDYSSAFPSGESDSHIAIFLSVKTSDPICQCMCI